MSKPKQEPERAPELDAESTVIAVERRQLCAVMFTDIVGYSTRMAGDERRALATLDRQRRLFTSLIEREHGRLLQETGDGTLTVFPSAISAIDCALDIQRALADEDFKVRIGLHLGDIVVRGDAIFGDDVNIAARLERIAPAGGICLSDPVAHAVLNKRGYHLEALGEQRLKNIPQPMRCFLLHTSRTQRSIWRGLWHRLRTPGMSFGAALLLLLAALILVWNRSVPAPPTPEKPPSLAVLPCVNLSDNNEDELFADGLTEEMLHKLAQVPGLRVPGRNSSFYFKARNDDLTEIAARLGVSHVLQGSVRRGGSRLRITVQLLETRQGYPLWSEAWDRDTADILKVQDEIATGVVERLRLSLIASDLGFLSRYGTRNTSAQLHLQQARSLIAQRNELALLRARNLLEQALMLDPDFGDAHAALGKTILLLSSYSAELPQTTAAELAAPHFARALALAPDSSEVRSAMVLPALQAFQAHPSRVNQAELEIRLNDALAIQADDAELLGWRGNQLVITGRPRDAIPVLQRAIERDPLSPRLHTILATAAGLIGDGDTAESELQILATRFPGNSLAIWASARQLAELGQADAAFRTVTAGFEISKDFRLGADSSDLLLLAGAADAALSVMRAAADRVPGDMPKGAVRARELVVGGRLAELEAALLSGEPVWYGWRSPEEMLARLYSEQGRDAEALALWRVVYPEFFAAPEELVISRSSGGPSSTADHALTVAASLAVVDPQQSLAIRKAVAAFAQSEGADGSSLLNRPYLLAAGCAALADERQRALELLAMIAQRWPLQFSALERGVFLLGNPIFRQLPNSAEFDSMRRSVRARNADLVKMWREADLLEPRRNDAAATSEPVKNRR